MSARIDMRKPSHNQYIESEICRLRDQGYDKGEIFEKLLCKYSDEKLIDDAVEEWSWFCVYRDQKRAPRPSCICGHGVHRNKTTVIKPLASIVIQFLLWNRFNHNVIRVGSECVKDFIDARVLTKIKRQTEPFSIYRCPTCGCRGVPQSATILSCQNCDNDEEPDSDIEIDEIDFDYETNSNCYLLSEYHAIPRKCRVIKDEEDDGIISVTVIPVSVPKSQYLAPSEIIIDDVKPVFKSRPCIASSSTRSSHYIRAPLPYMKHQQLLEEFNDAFASFFDNPFN